MSKISVHPEQGPLVPISLILIHACVHEDCDLNTSRDPLRVSSVQRLEDMQVTIYAPCPLLNGRNEAGLT